jgi:hypothetical protein
MFNHDELFDEYTYLHGYLSQNEWIARFQSPF